MKLSTSRILAVCSAAFGSVVVVAAAPALAQQSRNADRGATGAPPARPDPAVGRSASAAPASAPAPRDGASEAPAAEGALNGVVYQPARASLARGPLDPGDAAEEAERGRLAEESTLVADPAAQQPVPRIQGVAIIADTPDLSDEQ